MFNNTRRSFLKKQLALMGCIAAGLDVISAPARAADFQDYKALVCVLLSGGNDSYNMFVPVSTSAHADYADVRQFLALPRNQLRPVSPVTYTDGISYAFHPIMTESQRLFEERRLAVIANVGSLVQPITKQEYEASSSAIPTQLFSHNDQTDSWLAANAGGRSRYGWAGRTMDIMYPGNIPTPSPSISTGGYSLWQAAQNVRPFEVGTNGVNSRYLPGPSGNIRLADMFSEMHSAATQETNLLAREHALTLERDLEYGNRVNTALGYSREFTMPFTGGFLAAQLNMVARLIDVRNRLDSGLKRQVFFVRLGGWDTHQNRMTDRTGGHQDLLRQVDLALSAFYSAMADLGEQSSVTTFTATEFGRSLSPNNSGTDHGWGGHNLVMGGAVQGGDIFGQMPQVSRDSPDTVENSRLIPSSSVDQYSATLAHWFGLTETELSIVFPNLINFASPDMGFLL